VPRHQRARAPPREQQDPLVQPARRQREPQGQLGPVHDQLHVQLAHDENHLHRCGGHEAFQVSALKSKAYVDGDRIPVEMDACVGEQGLEGIGCSNGSGQMQTQ